MYGNHMAGWGWAVMVFWSAVAIGLLSAAVWALVSWARGGSRSTPAEKTARDVLDERPARGEIDLVDHSARRQAMKLH
jgi:uncharacterized membrane protein